MAGGGILIHQTFTFAVVINNGAFRLLITVVDLALALNAIFLRRR